MYMRKIQNYLQKVISEKLLKIYCRKMNKFDFFTFFQVIFLQNPFLYHSASMLYLEMIVLEKLFPEICVR